MTCVRKIAPLSSGHCLFTFRIGLCIKHDKNSVIENRIRSRFEKRREMSETGPDKSESAIVNVCRL